MLEAVARHPCTLTGLHGTTTDDISAEAGLGNGALYRYFDGKAAIVEEIAAQRHAQEPRLLDEALRDDDPRRAVHDYVVSYLGWLADPEELRRRRVNVHVWAEALADDRLATVVAAGMARRVTRRARSRPPSIRARSLPTSTPRRSSR